MRNEREFTKSDRSELSVRISLLMQSINTRVIKKINNERNPNEEIISGYDLVAKQLNFSGGGHYNIQSRWRNSIEGRLKQYVGDITYVDQRTGRYRLNVKGVDELIKLLNRAEECGLENLDYDGKISSKQIGKVRYASLSPWSFKVVREVLKDYAKKIEREIDLKALNFTR